MGALFIRKGSYTMRMYDIISKKRHGLPLSKEEIEFAVNGYVSGDIPDYQMSALLMAICINSMNEEETALLTKTMMSSGDVLDLSCFGNLTVDKHSTGGVGDKTTLIVAPIAASLGCKVAKMSGRGLGFTGGTVDKLEAISGYNTSLSVEDFFSQVEKIGIAVIGQTGNLAPADKKIYALRDVTATIDSVPLIASSIMSKKLAAGSSSIVLDVKCGSGAFMKDRAGAISLAEAMVKIGKSFGRRVRAVITNMDAPLGVCVGNSLEICEAVDVLKGKGDKKLTSLCLTLAANMVSLSFDIPYKEAYEKAVLSLESGKAFEKMLEWVSYQGGDARLIKDTSLLPLAKHRVEVKSDFDGYVCHIDAERIGLASTLLGAGRAKKDDLIDFGAGIVLKVGVLGKVSKGDTLAVAYASDKTLFDGAEKLIKEAFSFSDKKPEEKELILDTIS